VKENEARVIDTETNITGSKSRYAKEGRYSAEMVNKVKDWALKTTGLTGVAGGTVGLKNVSPAFLLV